MEVEAKFSIPDESTYQRLLGATSLAGFRLGELVVDKLGDSYLDTNSGAFRAAGFAYRLRQKNDSYLATIKSLGEVSGAIHRRVEYELDLPRPLSAQDWPAGKARDLALRLGGVEPPVPVLGVEQVRHVAVVHQRCQGVAAHHRCQVVVARRFRALARFRAARVDPR